MAATIQKTTIRRYNGTDWDPLYLATSADIVELGKAATVAKNETPFAYGDTLAVNENLADLVARVINRMATVEAEVLPKIADGTNITNVNASAISGRVSFENLPVDVSGKGVEVENEEKKAELTKANVNPGDIVKVTGGKVYLVTAVSTESVTYMELTDSASSVAWSRITGTPTTLTGYGITDAINTSEKAVAGGAAAAGKVAVADENGKLAFDITGDAATLEGHAASYFTKQTDFETLDNTINTAGTGALARIGQLETDIKKINVSWIDDTSGTLPLAVIPKVALSKMYVATEYNDLQSLTTTQVQDGDTVKIADKAAVGNPGEGGYTPAVIGEMYYVVDQTKLGTADWQDAFMPYSADRAAAVEWTGVLNHPTTLAGYGITDAVNVNDVTVDGTVAAAKGKILKVGDDNKLHVSITGDAATLEGHAASYFATDDAFQTLSGVVGDENDGLVKTVNGINATIGNASTADTILYDIAQLKTGEAVANIAASKITDKLTRAQLPDDISGRTHVTESLDACFDSLTSTNASKGDLVLAGGKLYSVVDTAKLDEAAGYQLLVDIAGSTITWEKVDHPTTLTGYGIIDAVNVADVVEDGTLETSKGKLVKVGTDGLLHVNISGDAATLGGKAPSHYATQSGLDAVSLRAPMLVDAVTDVQNPVEGQMVLVPVTAG